MTEHTNFWLCLWMAFHVIYQADDPNLWRDAQVEQATPLQINIHSFAQRMSYLQEIDLLVVKFPVTVQTLVIISMWSLGRCLGSNYQTVPSAVGKQKSVGIEWNDGSSPSIPYSLAKSSCTQKNQVRLSVNQLRSFRKTFVPNCGIEWKWVICRIE